MIGALRKLVAILEREADECDVKGQYIEYWRGNAAGLKDGATRLSTLIDAHAATSGWLPIESAPKDGTRICVAEYDDLHKRWRFSTDYWRKYNPIFGRGEGFGGSGSPSHWPGACNR